MGAASAGVFVPGITLADARPSKRTGIARHSLSKVSSTLSGYSDQLHLVGLSAAVEATGSDLAVPVHILASIDDQERLQTFFQNPDGLPFKNVHIQGNNLTFRYGSRDFIVENLPPDECSDRLAQIHRQGHHQGHHQGNTEAEGGTLADYAHQYLTSDIKGRNLTDPHNAISGGKPRLRSLRDASSPPIEFASIIRGMIDSAQLGIEPDATLTAEWSNSLSQPTAGAADHVTTTLLANLSTLASNLSSQQLIALLKTPLVKTSLTNTLGISSTTIINRFQSLASTSRRTAPRILWLAAFLKESSGDTPSRTICNAFLTTTDHSARRTASKDWHHAIRLT